MQVLIYIDKKDDNNNNNNDDDDDDDDDDKVIGSACFISVNRNPERWPEVRININ